VPAVLKTKIGNAHDDDRHPQEYAHSYPLRRSALPAEYMGDYRGILPSLQLTYGTRLMAICPERDTAR
jgi:hypothetical protein